MAASSASDSLVVEGEAAPARAIRGRVDLYVFSGTGNTLLIARELKAVFEEGGVPVRLLPMDQSDPGGVDLSAALGLAFPVAVQGTYPLVWTFVRGLPPAPGTPAFMVDTMLGYSGGLVWPMRRMLVSKGYVPCGAREIIMPSNIFVARGMTARKRRRIARGLEMARSYGRELLQGTARWVDAPVYSTLLSFISRSAIFWNLSRRLTPVVVDPSTCTSCGLCARLCPVGNITIEAYPVFACSCVLCMRCFSFCPEEAIGFRHYRSARYRAVGAAELLPRSREL